MHTLEDVHALYEGGRELVRAYELDTASDVDALLADAIDQGRIDVGSEGTWRRAFASEAELARDVLDH